MTQKLATPLEQQVVGPHIRHPNPHPQYLLDADAITQADVDAVVAAAVAALQAEIDALQAEIDALESVDTSTFVIGPSGGALFDITDGELVWDVTVDPPVQVFV